ncbi:MAG TPA: response regulator [Pyrinomonadaceae bacterium]|nr:response regulator [Pyrinomonadaceae bacterium]
MQATSYPRVMIAEASADTRDLLRHWLEMKRCRVVEAMNGQEAVSMSHDNCPDLILMNLNMPMLGGLDAARRIHEDTGNRGVPIVCMSTYPTKAAQVIALAAGCNGFISQPIDFDQLDALLETLLLTTAVGGPVGEA